VYVYVRLFDCRVCVITVTVSSTLSDCDDYLIVEPHTHQSHPEMMSLFTPSTSLTSSVTPQLIRDVINEVAAARSDNLAFRQAISEHERLNSSPNTLSSGSPKVLLKGRSSSNSSRGGNRRVNKSDLKLSPAKWKIPKGPGPPGQTVFDTLRYRIGGVTTPSNVTEQNFSFSLQSHPQAGSWTALFDQWCITQVTMEVHSIEPPGGTGSCPEVHTAIDFDSTGNLGSLQALDNFGSAQIDTLAPGKFVTRSCRPCLKPDVNGGAGVTVNRFWCDSAVQAIPWFGFRTMIAPTLSANSNFVITFAITYAFRNVI